MCVGAFRNVEICHTRVERGVDPAVIEVVAGGFHRRSSRPTLIDERFEGSYCIDRLFVLGLTLFEGSLGVFVLRQGQLQSCLRKVQLRCRLFKRFCLSDFRRSRPVHLIHGDELFFEQRLNAMKTIIRISPLRFGPGDTLLSVCHISPCLVNSRCPSGDVRLGTLDIGLCNRDGTDQRRYPSPLVFNLAFESRLLGQRVFERVAIWALIDSKQQFALLHELVVPHIQPSNRALHLRRNPNEICKHLGIVGSRIVVRAIKDLQAKTGCGYHDANTDQAAQQLACVQTPSHGAYGDADLDHAAQQLARFRISIHGSYLAKTDKPKCEGKQSSQTWINQNWRSERNAQTQAHPSGEDGEQNRRGQAHKPCREERPQYVERRSPLTTRKWERRHNQPVPHKANAPISIHGLAFREPDCIRLAVRNARSARFVRTCVRANTSVERACASVLWAAVTSRKLRTP